MNTLQPVKAGNTPAPPAPARITPIEQQVPLQPIPNLHAVIAAYAASWAQREADADQAGLIRLPVTSLDEFRQTGILAAPLPRALGGWECDLWTVCDGVRHLARVAPATALALAMPLGNAATTRIPAELVPAEYREALQQGKVWIAEQIRRGQILAVANSEPGAGGDLANTRTQAQLRDGLAWLTGRKSFATIGPDADYFLCAARYADGPQVGQIDGWFVARDAHGLVVDDLWNPLGMRTTASVGLTLHDTPAAALYGYPGCLTGINARHWSMLLFAAVFAGVGEGALEQGRAGAARSSAWTRVSLAEAALQQEAAAGFLQAVALDEQWPPTAAYQRRCRQVKTFVTRTSVDTAHRMLMLAGGRGYGPNQPVARFLRDALAGPLLRPPVPNAMDELARDLLES